MSNEQKPGDPADKAADGAFGGVQSHRAGYGDDKLARLTEWLRAHPTATLASGEGALLLAENDRLRDDLQKQADWADWAKGEIDRVEAERDALQRARDNAWKHVAQARLEQVILFRARADRAERILAALREPSDEALVATVQAVGSVKLFSVKNIIRAAVAAAEQEGNA